MDGVDDERAETRGERDPRPDPRPDLRALLPAPRTALDDTPAHCWTPVVPPQRPGA